MSAQIQRAASRPLITQSQVCIRGKLIPQKVCLTWASSPEFHHDWAWMSHRISQLTILCIFPNMDETLWASQKNAILYSFPDQKIIQCNIIRKLSLYTYVKSWCTYHHMHALHTFIGKEGENIGQHLRGDDTRAWLNRMIRQYYSTCILCNLWYKWGNIHPL